MAEIFENYFKSGRGNPTTNNVPGTLGQFYRDLDDNNKYYKLVSITESGGVYTYTWYPSAIDFYYQNN